MRVRAIINGFGRIGRLVLRAIQKKYSDRIEIVAVNDLVAADNLAYLLKYDTVHGTPPFSVLAEGDRLLVDGKSIRVFSEKDPSRLPLKDLEVDFVIEASGQFTQSSEAEKFLRAGAKKVVITAPAQGKVATFVMGVNEELYDPLQDHIVSGASCTTNCLAPLVKVLLDNFGIEEGLMTTVHAMTSSQPTVDGPSKKDWRGGRSASMNVIPSSTGAAKAVALCIPAVEGKLTGMAFRVPTIDVSALDLTVRLARDASYEDVCRAIKNASDNHLKGILDFCDEELVSSDFRGAEASCVFDKRASIALNSRFYKLIAWYDNEVGYACRIVDLVEYMARKGIVSLRE